MKTILKDNIVSAEVDEIVNILDGGGFFTGAQSTARTKWNNVSVIKSRISEIIAKLESGGLKATCCNDPCYEEKNKDSGALYVRPNDETPSLVNYRGKIIICPKGLKNNAEAWGGCGCLILHEVLHVIGLKANEEEFNRQNYRRDNAMIKLANELLKTSKKHCKGYDVK